jgi:hypothetical protein
LKRSLRALLLVGCELSPENGELPYNERLQNASSVYQNERVTCEEKSRLVGLYEEATGHFLEALKELRRKMGTSPKGEYERLDRAANEARVKSEQARLAVEQHVAAHRC